MKNFGMYELITMEPVSGYYHYYYFCTWGQAVRSTKMQRPIPEKIRLLVDDRYETPIRITILSPLQYLYRKYLKKGWTFSWGYRIHWEKEEL